MKDYKLKQRYLRASHTLSSPGRLSRFFFEPLFRKEREAFSRRIRFFKIKVFYHDKLVLNRNYFRVNVIHQCCAAYLHDINCMLTEIIFGLT
jgi:hypothetical protein